MARMLPCRSRVIPLALLCSTLPGCFLTHGQDSRPDGGAPLPADAGPPPPPPAFDAAPPPPIDPTCEPRQPDFACTDTETGSVPVGVPYALPIYIGDGTGCFCGETIECRAAVTGPGQLSLETALCSSEDDCGACLPYVSATCALPPLSEGVWRVQVDGLHAFELNVSDATPGVGPIDECQTTPVGDRTCGWVAPARPASVLQACFSAEAQAAQPVSVIVEDLCVPCGAVVGPCVVQRVANELRVVPTLLSSACDGPCPEMCTREVYDCAVPPLPAGEYTLRVDGLPEPGRLLVTEGGVPRPGMVCLSVPED